MKYLCVNTLKSYYVQNVSMSFTSIKLFGILDAGKKKLFIDLFFKCISTALNELSTDELLLFFTVVELTLLLSVFPLNFDWFL